MKKILITLAILCSIVSYVEADEVHLVPDIELKDSDVTSYVADEIAITVTYANGVTVRSANDGTFRIMEVDYEANGTGTEGAVVGESLNLEKLGAEAAQVPYDGYTYYSYNKNGLIVRLKVDSSNVIREVSHIVSI
jgi:hypothetical protein